MVIDALTALAVDTADRRNAGMLTNVAAVHSPTGDYPTMQPDRF